MNISRRGFLHTGVLSGVAGAGGLLGAVTAAPLGAAAETPPQEHMKLGMVTYNMGKDMTRDQLITFCKEVGLAGVELRTTHAHGVEDTLSKEERAAVCKQFEEGGVAIAGLGTIFQFHEKDPAVVAKNVAGAKSYAQLAADIGAPSIKTRPNGIFEDEPIEQTCERIGKAWREVAAFAQDLDVQIRMEVHGKGSSDPKNMRMMLDAADHPNAKICWNSNTGEQDENGSIKWGFDLLKHALGQVHINEIGVYQYPWQELFTLLKENNFTGFCLAEIAYNPEPERFMKHYKTLFDLYTGQYRYPR